MLIMLSVSLTCLPAATLPARAQPASLAASEMANAAQHFIDVLNDDGRTSAAFGFDDEERFNFHFIPRPRKGLPLRAMNLEQKRAAHDLLRAALSSRGYLKATAIMQLERVLEMIEENGPVRDPELYFLSIFGNPAGEAPWGWRLEGHHLSLNYTSASDAVTVTPAFFGANPAEVRTGPSAGLRVLAAEEDLARRLMNMLDDAQREVAVIAAEAPREIITGADREARLEGFEGLQAKDMTPAQRDQLWLLIREYTDNMPSGIAEVQLDKIRRAGLEELYFAWAGPLERGEGHYYRIHGPTVLFEYDNTQNEANHVHAIWRDLEDDFGRDMLRRHYDLHDHD